MSSANKSTVTSFQFCLLYLLHFSYCLAKSLNSVLNKNEDLGYPCLISDSGGNALGFFVQCVPVGIVVYCHYMFSVSLCILGFLS